MRIIENEHGRKTTNYVLNFRLLYAMPLLLLNPSLGFSTPPCDKAHYKRAEKALAQVNNWETLYRFYQHYPNCDSGYLGEGYSGTICDLFADHWSDVEIALKKMQQDKQFKSFLIDHIDSSVLQETLERISRNAQSGCPFEFRSNCRVIQETAMEALKDFKAESAPAAQLPGLDERAPVEPFHKN